MWITPDPVHGGREILAGGQVNVESLLLLEAWPAARSLAHRMGEGGRRPGEGRDFAEIVDGVWGFAQINRRYARHLEVLDRCPAGELADAGAL